MADNEQYSKEVLICHHSLSLFFLVTLLSHLITCEHHEILLINSSKSDFRVIMYTASVCTPRSPCCCF